MFLAILLEDETVIYAGSRLMTRSRSGKPEDAYHYRRNPDGSVQGSVLANRYGPLDTNTSGDEILENWKLFAEKQYSPKVIRVYWTNDIETLMIGQLISLRT